MKTTWRTLWQQNDIVVYRDEVEVDRLPAERIVRVYLVYRDRGDTPNDIAQTVVELDGDEGFALFEPETGRLARRSEQARLPPPRPRRTGRLRRGLAARRATDLGRPQAPPHRA